jgi:hypothetical protein
MRDTYRAHGNAYPFMGGISGCAVHKGAQEKNDKSKVNG